MAHCSHPATSDTIRAVSVDWSLAVSSAISVVCHVLALIIAFPEYRLPTVPESRLTVHLRRPASAVASAVTSPAGIAADQTSPPVTDGRDGQVQKATGATIAQAARFLDPPNLERLQTIPVAVEGHMTLRLRISALGTIDEVVLRPGSPVPQSLLDAVIAEIRSRRMQPAYDRHGREVASELDLVVHYSPDIELLNH